MELKVCDIMTFTEDSQRVLITNNDSYSPDKAIYYGEAQNIPQLLFNERVSKIYSDYIYKGTSFGSVIGIRICN